MIAYDLPHRRQHLHFAPAEFPSPRSSHLGFFDTQPHTAATPSPSELATEKILRGYFSNPNLAFNNVANSADSDSTPQSLLMNSGLDFNPAIRVQPSTPISQLPTGYTPSSMFTSNMGNNNWNLYGNMEQISGSNSLQTPNKNSAHRRAGSASSMGSDFSSASHANASSVAATSNFNSADQAIRSFSNHLPTPTQTPTQDTFTNQSNTFANNMASNAPAMYAMKEALMDGDEDVPQFGHSSRHSVSSFGQNSPATPRGDDFDEKIRSNDIPQSTPKVDDMSYQGLSTFPTSTPRLQNQQATSKNMLSVPGSYHPSVNERLRAANDARSQSPSSSSRGVSPFRNGSPLNPVRNSFGSPQRIGTASGLRESQRASPNNAMKQYTQSAEEPKTISPKDALLEYNDTEEDSKVPLFSENESNNFTQQFNNGAAFDQNSTWSSSQGTTTSSMPDFSFMPQLFAPGMAQAQFPQFSPSQYRSASAKHEATPEFPAHLTSMESTASEAASDSGRTGELTRPSQPTSGRGTYSCTYHGCSERFDSPQKLQKHKRDGHRQNVTSTPVITPGVGSGMSSAELMKRNSQQGPHKCDRINPTTGKPCNTEFSRPYDLTRHEDTIHNNRKQKVRCALCTEEKTFSRNDALTRHMRVVHPEVDFPGKHRRRGGSD